MDELAKALAEAIRNGSTLAPYALYGYYMVRVIEALVAPIAFIMTAVIASRVIMVIVKRTWDYYDAHPGAPHG